MAQASEPVEHRTDIAAPLEEQPQDAGSLGHDSPVAPRRSLLRTVALSALGLVAGAAFLPSGVLLLLALSITPNPGMDAVLLILKVIDLVGWLAIGSWLLADWSNLRLRVLLPPIAGYLWAYPMAALIGKVGYLNWGY